VVSDATETVFIVGAHTTYTHPVIWMQVKTRAKKGGLNLILADPRETDLVKNAAVHLKVKPGTDIFWIKALGKVIIDRGWHIRRFARSRLVDPPGNGECHGGRLAIWLGN
jgi:predicted molibdopterin-dependent oxidoreductase YjgC